MRGRATANKVAARAKDVLRVADPEGLRGQESGHYEVSPAVHVVVDEPAPRVLVEARDVSALAVPLPARGREKRRQRARERTPVDRLEERVLVAHLDAPGPAEARVGRILGDVARVVVPVAVLVARPRALDQVGPPPDPGYRRG